MKALNGAKAKSNRSNREAASKSRIVSAAVKPKAIKSRKLVVMKSIISLETNRLKVETCLIKILSKQKRDYPEVKLSKRSVTLTRED